MSLLAVDAAQARLLALAPSLAAEEAALVDAAGRYAAADIVARRTQPAADLSAMDGYAIRFAELPGPWTIVGESKAGGGLMQELAPGEAARIFTGAPLPIGADTILVQEDATRDGGIVQLAGTGPPTRGAHVRREGSDFASGDTLLRAGVRLSPARIALAALGGYGTLPVRSRARVRLLSTGDELVQPGAPTPGVNLPASNAPMLAALLAQAPAIVRDGGIVPDRLDLLTRAFQDAAADADVIVTTGGASVGDHDLVRPALQAAGAELDFWRVAMRPGKPLMAGRLGNTLVLGLPGNPVSAFVTAHLFLLPLLAHLAGAADPLPRTERMPLGCAVRGTGERADYIRATIRDGVVHPLLGQDSAALAIMADVDALIVRQPGSASAAVGNSVDILRIA